MSRFSLDPRAARATWTILVFLGALGLLYAMRGMLFIVALSLFFAYLLFPLVRLAQRWLIESRPVAIVVVYMVVLAALGGAGVAIGPRLSTEVQSLAQKLPEMSTQIQSGELVRVIAAGGTVPAVSAHAAPGIGRVETHGFLVGLHRLVVQFSRKNRSCCLAGDGDEVAKGSSRRGEGEMGQVVG